MTNPIRPEEVTDGKKFQMPDAVLESFNALIARNFSGGRATVKQNDIVTLIASKGFHRQEVFDNHWLDVEDIYRQAGWEVTYEKPGYNESYEAYFMFVKPRKSPKAKEEE